MKEKDWMDARGLKRFVRQSARRKQLDAEREESDSRQTTIETAAAQKEEREEEFSQSRPNYLPVIWLCVAMAVLVGGGFLTFRLVQELRIRQRSAWTRPAASPEELLAVEEYARQVILRAEQRVLPDSDFHSDVPVYWREKAQRVLKELAQDKGVIEDVYLDDKGHGDHPNFIVECRGKHGGVMITIGSSDGTFHLIKVNKSW